MQHQHDLERIVLRYILRLGPTGQRRGPSWPPRWQGRRRPAAISGSGHASSPLWFCFFIFLILRLVGRVGDGCGVEGDRAAPASTSSTSVTIGVPSRPDGSTTVMPRVMPGASATSTEARIDLVTIAGSTTTAAASGSTKRKWSPLPWPAMRCRAWLASASREGLLRSVRDRRQQRVDLRAGHEVRHAGLPRHDHRVDLGGKDDCRRLGIGIDVELGRRRRVAAAVDGAAHDGEPADAADDAGIEPQRQRQIGQRSDHQDVDLLARGRGFAKVAARKPTASLPAGAAVLVGRGAPPSPSSPCTCLASMIGCASGRRRPCGRGCRRRRRPASPGCSRSPASSPTLPNTVVMACRARGRPRSSRSSAWASSTPPSVSRMSLLDWPLMLRSPFRCFVDARPEVPVGLRILALRIVGKIGAAPADGRAPAARLHPDMADVAAAAGIDQQRLEIRGLGIARAAQMSIAMMSAALPGSIEPISCSRPSAGRPSIVAMRTSSLLAIGWARPSRCEATSPATRISAIMS